MKVSRFGSERKAFVLDKKNAVKIFNSHERFVSGCQHKSSEITVLCSDSLRRHFASVGDLLRYENGPSASIKEVCFSASGYCDGKLTRSELTLRDNNNDSIVIHVNGPEDKVMKINNELEERISSMRPWYAPIAEVDLFSLIALGCVALLLVLLALLVIGHFVGAVDLGSGEGSSSHLLSTAVGVLGGVSIVIFGMVTTKIVEKVFPIASFCVGQGVKRYANMNLVRNAVFIGLLVSILGSVIVSIVFN